VTTPSDHPQSTPTLFQTLFRRATLLAFFAGVATTMGIGAVAGMAVMGSWHHESLANMSPAERSAHVQKMLQHLYIEIDATDAQKAKLDPIVKAAVNDLLPLHAQFHGAHEQLLGVLTQDTIDRAALENLRASHIQLADQASKRITQALADVGDVLTPAQRTKLAETFARHAGMQHQ